jgi:U2 small nuclear ribonucleoprotein A'
LDISDNEIRKLNNFPAMRRLTTILANNNYISRIEKLGESLTGITSLILTNNRIANLSEIDNIATLNHLEHLSLIDNPVTLKSNYRLYVMHKIPSLKSLDFRKIQQKEKDAAKKYFKSVLGKAMLSDISAESSMNSNSENHPDGRGDVAYSSSHALSEVTPLVLTEEQKKIVREAIESATTKGEIDLIEKQLKVGVLSIMTIIITLYLFIYLIIMEN